MDDRLTDERATEIMAGMRHYSDGLFDAHEVVALATRIALLEARIEAAEKVAASADQIIIAHRANYTGPDAERNKRGEIRGAMRAISKALAAYRATEAANG